MGKQPETLLPDEEGDHVTKGVMDFVEQASLQRTASPTEAHSVESFCRTLKRYASKARWPAEVGSLVRFSQGPGTNRRVFGVAPSNAKFVGLATLLPRRSAGRRR
jgi:hypothetical protein